MANQWNSPLWTDGTWSTATAVSLPVLTSPMPLDTASYILTQDFMQFLVNFTPLALDTAHPSAGLTPDYSDFKLAAESERKDVGGGVVRWTRTYAKIPASWSKFETFAFTFPGIPGDPSSVPAIQDRLKFSKTVVSQVTYDYFRTSTPGTIAVVRAMPFCYQATSGGTNYGGINFPTDDLTYWSGVSAGLLASYPTKAQWATMVQDALTNAWGATKTVITMGPSTGFTALQIDTGASTLGGRVPAEDSRLDQWHGNIWQRTSRYVLAI